MADGKPGAPFGNKNAAKENRRWEEAILRALSRKRGSIDNGLDAAADKLVALALDRGDRWALDHIADRIDGKPTPQQDVPQLPHGGALIQIAFVNGIAPAIEAAASPVPAEVCFAVPAEADQGSLRGQGSGQVLEHSPGVALIGSEEAAPSAVCERVSELDRGLELPASEGSGPVTGAG